MCLSFVTDWHGAGVPVLPEPDTGSLAETFQPQRQCFVCNIARET